MIIVKEFCGNYAQDKDAARELREKYIRPAIEKGKVPIVLDFANVDATTQSFVHALLSGLFQEYGEKTLEYFEFKNCNQAVKSLIAVVINYSLD